VLHVNEVKEMISHTNRWTSPIFNIQEKIRKNFTNHLLQKNEADCQEVFKWDCFGLLYEGYKVTIPVLTGKHGFKLH